MEKATIQCANCQNQGTVEGQKPSRADYSNKLCLHCENIMCSKCFTSHVSQLKSHLGEISQKVQESKAKWNTMVQVSIEF